MADFTDNVEGSADSEAQKAVTGVGSGGGGSSDPPVAPLPSPRPVVMVNTLDDLERTLKALSPVQRYCQDSHFPLQCGRAHALAGEQERDSPVCD